MVVGTAQGNLCEACLLAGRWDEAEAIAASELERAERAGGLYSESVFMFVQAELALVCAGRVEDAVASARRQVLVARSREDDQVVLPALASAAWLLARGGHETEAASLLDEFLERRIANPGGVSPGYWMVYAALALDRVGRGGALASLHESSAPRFLEAALEIDAGRPDEAAEMLRAIGVLPLEAEARIVAAREDVDRERNLERARELLQRLGAIARLRELDAEIEATSRSAGN
jgi:hypothetical protein